MNEELNKKKQYFKDSVYLKYENLKNQECENHETKNKKGLNRLQKIAVVIIAGMVSLTVYAGMSGNFSFEKLGLIKLSQNYEDSKIELNKTIELENCDITLTGMAADSAYIILEYRLDFKNDYLKQIESLEYFKENELNLIFDKKVLVNSHEVPYVIEYAEKVSENECTITQIVNVMEINNNCFNLEINLDRLYPGYLPYAVTDENVIRVGKKISAKIELEGNLNKEVISEQQIDDHTKIILERIANTKFQTYITLKEVTEGINFEEYNETNPMEFTRFIISDENDNKLSYITYDESTAGKKVYVKENGEYKEKSQTRMLQNTDIIKIEKNYFILLEDNENVDKIKVTPIKTRIYEDRKLNKNGNTEEGEMYDKAKWDQLELGDKKYSAIDTLGGTFEVEKIDADDENIYFYYNEKGLIGNEWKIIIREKNKGFNYIHMTNQEQKHLNSGENRIVFSKDPSEAAGAGIHNERLDNLENLEFTLLFGSNSEKVGNEIIVDAPKLNEETAKINNLEFTDIDLKLTQKELERTPDMSSKYMKKEDLNDKYSKEDAIKDNCFVVDKGVVISNDKEQLDKFMEDCNNGKNGVIRVYTVHSLEWVSIMDIEFTNGIFYVEEYSLLGKKNIDGNFYGTTQMIKDKNEEDKTYSYTLIGENNIVYICKIKM